MTTRRAQQAASTRSSKAADEAERSQDPSSIVARSRELAMVRQFLEEIGSGPSALVLEGAVGSGKTTLLQATISAGRERGYRILFSHPVESEESLPFAALGDLLKDVIEDRHLGLPAPQERALRVAVLIEASDEEPPDRRAVSVATFNALRAISRRAPVLIAVDDMQWMDPPSARVLDFVVRRLETEPLGVAAAVRSEDPRPAPTVVDRSLSGREPHRLALGPMGKDALDALFRARLGQGLPRSTLAQVDAASGGNPLFALELARAILRGDVQPTSGEPLAVPGTLQQFVHERLTQLPSDVRELLFMAAAVSNPTLELLEASAERPESVPAAVQWAVAAGVIEAIGPRLRFVHPLFASTLYHAVGPNRRRALHRRLAPLLQAPDERARHLALGAEGPDPAVAAALDEAARVALARGAPDAAAEMSEQAHSMTAAADAVGRDRRRIEAAEYHFAAGNLERARHIFEETAGVLPPGSDRASVLRRLAKVRYRMDSCSVAAQLLTRALNEAGGDGDLRAGIERDLAWAVMLCGDMQAAAEHATSALRLVEENPDHEMFGEILAATAMADFLQGRGLTIEAMRRTAERERLSPQTPIEWRPSMMLAMTLKWSGDTPEASRRFEDIHRRTVEAGEETSLPFLLTQMSETATWEGDWAAALRHANEAHTVALQTGQEPMRAGALYAKGLAEAHLGRTGEARASARAGLELSERVGSVVMMMWNQTVLGFVEISLDDPVAAHSHLGPLVAWLDVVGIREPGVLRFVPEEVEALVALNELQKADALLASYEADATRLQRQWALLAAARCRALHSAATGDPAGAAASLGEAILRHAGAVPPFERARALLVLGSVLRRTRRRRAARESIQEALDVFQRLGAQVWEAKAVRMLGRARESAGREPLAQLTPSEMRVARAVAAGATNREVAARLFVSVRTVELHLTSVYRKLGIRSRTELALKLTTETERGPQRARE